MRLGTCVALELVFGASAALGLALATSWGLSEVRTHWQAEARAAEGSQPVMARQLPTAAVATRGTRSGARSGTGTQAERPATVLELDLSARTGVDLSRPGESPPGGTDESTQKLTAGETARPAVVAEPLTVDDEPLPTVANKHREWRKAPYYGVFHGVRDDLLLAPLRGSPIKEVKYNRGGSSISLRLEFANGARAAFKPQQDALQTIPRREVAAYRIDRLLGLNAVPPSITREFSTETILAAVVPSSQAYLPRLRDEMRADENGNVKGELSWWIPVIERARIQGYEIDTTDGIVTWKRYLAVGTDMPEADVPLLMQISSMVLFDFIINNPDRWSGANARVSEDGRTLYFMDNTMSFGGDGEGHRKCRIYLRRSQKFSWSLVAALRGLSRSQVDEYMSWDLGPYDQLLTDREIDALIARRDYALAYIDELIAEHGEDAVLVFP